MSEDLLTRRMALKFAGAISLAACVVPWTGLPAASGSARGYGPDPDLLKRTVTWSRTLDAAQLASLEALCEMVLPEEPPHPSAAKLGVQEFIDEWVSAPYPRMRADREVILGGLASLGEAMRREHGVSFHEATAAQRSALFDRFCDSATTVGFARRLIELVCAGYYTTREGHLAIGYVGNVALTEFPPPSAAVVKQFEATLSQMIAGSPQQRTTDTTRRGSAPLRRQDSSR